MPVVTWLLLALLGLAISTYGTLIGTGGGFMLVPTLLLLFPNESPSLVTATSLSVVLISAVSGSIAYARQRRIDYVSVLTFGGPSIPGAVLGAQATHLVQRGTFDAILGVVLVALALFLILRPQPVVVVVGERRGHVTRFIRDASGMTYFYTYNRLLAVVFGVGLGFVAAFFGIGGASILIPLMIQFLHFPAYIATATGQAVLLMTTSTALATHLFAGTLAEGQARVFALAIGALVGAQVGARLSRRLRAVWLVRAMAFALVLVGIRLIVNGLGPVSTLLVALAPR